MSTQPEKSLPDLHRESAIKRFVRDADYAFFLDSALRNKIHNAVLIAVHQGKDEEAFLAICRQHFGIVIRRRDDFREANPPSDEAIERYVAAGLAKGESR